MSKIGRLGDLRELHAITRAVVGLGREYAYEAEERDGGVTDDLTKPGGAAFNTMCIVAVPP